jgi:hypothetical protein
MLFGRLCSVPTSILAGLFLLPAVVVVVLTGRPLAPAANGNSVSGAGTTLGTPVPLADRSKRGYGK